MKKRILYIGNALSHKGKTATGVDTLGVLLRNEGFQVITASSVSNKVLRLLDMVYHTLRYARTSNYVLIDAYSTSNYWYAYLVSRLCRLLSTPYIPILHGGNLPDRLFKSKRTSRALFGKAYKNVAPSGYMHSVFEKSGFNNLVTIPNSIEIDVYPFRERKSLSKKLLWVRSFSTIYNPLMALKVLKNLLQTYPEATLTMVGPKKDESYEECYAFAKAHKLPVTFTGLLSKEEWVTLAASHDIFISTTNFDNTPVSVIEAMALGLPVVSTNVGGMPFLIQDGTNGLLTPAREVQGFVNCVSQLLDDSSGAKRLAQNARTKAETFDWDPVKKRWYKLLS